MDKVYTGKKPTQFRCRYGSWGEGLRRTYNQVFSKGEEDVRSNNKKLRYQNKGKSIVPE